MSARIPGLLALCALGSLGSLLAEEPHVRALAEPTRVEEGEEVVLTVEIIGSSQSPEEPPDLSRLTEFTVAEGPSVSSVFQWVNGRTSASRTYRYTLVPQGTGTKTIPPLTVMLGGRLFRTDPVTVEVVPRAAASPGWRNRGAQEASPFSDPRMRQRLAQANPKAASTFVEAEVDKSDAFPGEQVTLTYVVYTQHEIAQLSLQDQPTYRGFWVEDLKTDTHYEARTVTRPEGTFLAYTVLKKALFPTNPGTLTIPPLTFHFAVRRRANDPLDSFFFQPTESLFRSTQAVPIRVRPLPEEGRPADFSGAVGRFNLHVTTDRATARVNDAVGLKVLIEGQGNFNTLGKPTLPSLDDFKQYEPKVEGSTEAKGGTLVGKKTWDYVLIPLASGRQQIPPVRFTFFDPGVRQYRILQSEPIALQIAKGDLAEVPMQAPPTRSQIPVLGSDIRYIKLAGGGIRDQRRTLYGSRAFAALLAFPVLLNASLLVMARRRASLSGNAALVRRRRARRMAQKRFSRARSRMQPAHSRDFYQELASALTAYLADKASVPASGLTYDRIEEILLMRGIEGKARERFRRCLETCDFARFAPTSSERGEMERTLSEAAEVIEAIEGRVKAS